MVSYSFNNQLTTQNATKNVVATEGIRVSQTHPFYIFFILLFSHASTFSQLE